MKKYRIANIGVIAVAALVAVVFGASHTALSQESLNAAAHPGRTLQCSIATIAGAWVFYTGVFTDTVPLSDGGAGFATALGTFNISRRGELSGRFDYNGSTGFIPDIRYAGTVTVKPDCTGAVEFSDNDEPDVKVEQSIVIARNGREIHGMFKDAATVWTYSAQRIDEGERD
jgi:hypothetical protein